MEGAPFAPAYYGEDDLRRFGFRSVGHDVRIAKNCTIIGIPNISFGSYVRIDGHTVITAVSNSVEIGSYIHVGGDCYLLGAGGISIHDFSTCSHGVKLYSGSDDYSGNHMTNPTVPAEYTNVSIGRIVLKKHVVVGSGSVILPGAIIGEGTAVGALSLVKSSLDDWSVYGGIPARWLKERSRELLKYEKQLLETR
jgi:galactoside O-acetyltransferase